MKKVIISTILLLGLAFTSLNAQHLEGILSDGQQMDEGKISVAASLDIDNEGLFLRGRYALSIGELFGGVGLYDEFIGTHLFLGLERAHRSFEVAEGMNLHGFYQFAVAYRLVDNLGLDLTSTTFRASYLVRNEFTSKISVYTGLTGAFITQSVELNPLGSSTQINENDVQFTLPIGARFKLDEAGKMNIFTELGLGFSTGAGYLHAGFRYGL
jgi:hypothetical protein